MPKKRLAKRVNKQVNSAATISQLDKDFSTLPAKLASEINKELSALKKKESELKKAVAQTTSELKATESHIKTAAKSQQTAKGKKQLASAKKALKEASNIHRALVSELNSIAKTIASHTSKLAKLTALRKTLAQFDKDWTKKAKSAAMSVKKAKAKRGRKKAPRLAVVNDKAPVQTNIETFDTSVENVTLDKTADMAS